MSKRINLDNLKTFLKQLKTHITDPIKNDVSTLNTKVHNAENNIETANSNISSVQQSLNDYLHLSGGNITGDIALDSPSEQRIIFNNCSKFTLHSCLYKEEQS